MHSEKGHGTAYKMAMTLGMKSEIMHYEFPIDCICHVMSICHSKFMGDKRVCMRTATRVCDDILRSQRTIFQFECPASCVFNIGDVAHEASSLTPVHSLLNRKPIMTEPCLLPSFSSCIVSWSTIFKGNNMSICLVADAQSAKAWTTVWMVTICIASVEGVFVSTRAHNARSYQCLQGAPN